MRGSLRIGLLCIAALILGDALPARAGAAEQTCNQDVVTVDALRFELVKPKTCPPGDLLVRDAKRDKPVTLSRALWIAGFGKTRLPAVVNDYVVWLQSEGEKTQLRVTRLSTGESYSLGTGGYTPGTLLQSGQYLALGESRDPIPSDIRMAIPHRMVVIDLAAKKHPALLPAEAQPPWPGADLALERIFDGVKDAPGSFWFLLSGLSPTQPPFRIGRYRDRAVQFAIFDRADYRSYAYLVIEPSCGLVAWNACDAVHDRAPGCHILLRGLGEGRSATIDLPATGYVGRLLSLTSEALTYSWISQTTYAEETKTHKLPARCKP